MRIELSDTLSVRIELSDDAMDEYHRLADEEPDRHGLLVDDLTMLGQLSIDELERWTSLASFVYVLGPTGRVRYWVVIDDDLLVIEFFDLD